MPARRGSTQLDFMDTHSFEHVRLGKVAECFWKLPEKAFRAAATLMRQVGLESAGGVPGLKDKNGAGS